MITRRGIVMAAAAGALGTALPGRAGARAAAGWTEGLAAELARIEASAGCRLGVFVLDSGSGESAGYREGERFPLCSTFKVLAASAVLARVDAGKEQLSRRIRFEKKDLVVYSPVTKERVDGDGMSLAEICDAALTMSDNTAGNLLLSAIGGPAGLTAYARSLGDEVTRLDRIEPGLNEAMPGDPRDTTSPAAMAADLRKLLLGDALSAKSREMLAAWMVGCKTGDTRLRAGMPAGWRIGEKTGAGDQGTTNDVGVIWPPNRAPGVVAAYLTQSERSMTERFAVIAEVGRIVARRLGG